MQYRRYRQQGGSYFFTVVTYQRQNILTRQENIERLRAAFKREMEKYPFTIDAIIILPDHLHTIWSLPKGDNDFSNRWSRIKRYFSVGCIGAQQTQFVSRSKKREKAVWQKRFWEHVIRDDDDLQRHMDYIHYNPVKHGYVTAPLHWPYSSFKRFVQKGWYSEQWGSHEPNTIAGLNHE
jgi:putative transposase